MRLRIEGQITALRSPAVNVRALGFEGLKARGDAALPAVAALLDDENPYMRARAVWLLAQLGPDGIDARGNVDRQQTIRCCGSPPIAHCAQTGRARSVAARLARDPSPAVRREVALSLRDVPFEESRDRCCSRSREGYDGKDRSYLEAWGIGATNKEDALYAALMAQAAG